MFLKIVNCLAPSGDVGEGAGGDLAQDCRDHPRVSGKGTPKRVIQIEGDAELDF